MFKLVKLIKNNQQPTNPEAGYTILESIIAMLIVAVLMSVVAPVIGFSVGTRVSAKRTELASQAARSYLDWLKVDTENRGPTRTTQDKVQSADPPSPSVLNSVCEKATKQYCDETGTPPRGQIFCVDGDGDNVCSKDSLKDMIVQAISKNKTWDSVGTVTPEYYKRGYDLGIRVYRADAFNETELKTETSSTSVNNVGGDRRYPLVTLTTEIGPTADSFENTRLRIFCKDNPTHADCQ